MSSDSTALYRKYRPATFAEVRNQDHIITVLEGALKKDTIPHALLFTGPRGTGKTTVARIFAHAVGAEDVDIYEIDAASNRGIDDIRELRESVHTLPYASPYKVYIIDEVHMLTKEAFNALLKTLEEPPSHVLFVLATTEKDKLLDTITSRCQLFTFRAPSREELKDTVLSVAKKERFTLDAAGADIIALAAQGSYRDALGITQKVMLASSDTKLTADEIAIIVGAPKIQILLDLITSFHTKDSIRGLDALARARESGTESTLLYALLLEWMRSVILVRYKALTEESLIEHYGEETAEALISYGRDAKSSINSHLLTRMLEMSVYIGKSPAGLLPLELLVIEHAQAQTKS